MKRFIFYLLFPFFFGLPLIVALQYGDSGFISKPILLAYYGITPFIIIDKSHVINSTFKSSRMKYVGMTWYYLSFAVLLSIEGAWLSLTAHISSAGYCMKGTAIMLIVSLITFLLEYFVGERIYPEE